MTTLANQISAIVNEHYYKLKPTGKPITRSNGVPEWTVLAAVVAIDQFTNKLRLISLATGVKATPDAELRRSNGRILHDCHAEILSLRAFNAVLLEHMYRIRTEGSSEFSDLLEESEDKKLFRIKKNYSFALYISKVPCGDSSMNILEDDDANESLEQFSCQYVDSNNRTLLRGRSNYKKKGFVRTKPGRKDSKITLSKSCSDKLCIRQMTSILNSLTWDLIVEPAFLKYIVIPNLSQSAEIGLRRSFKERLSGLGKMQEIEFLSCTENFCHEKTSELQSPSLLSAILLNIEDGKQAVQEVVLNGVKNGFYVKGSKPLRKNSESSISRLSQWKVYQKLRPIDSQMSYLEFKSTQIARNAIKEKVRIRLSADGWISTKEDDCK
ncbi:LAFE_0F17744g1_1 [Lachancea fermentati]|uniref:LAFE_0F17744g1_1 n=1 Tax=Lachancea fermentati TaxID=4955 RepID=A0A1G4MGE9_LACFM|nr:LAFE_0F17744g1_1 [Lachancea fermentati]